MKKYILKKKKDINTVKDSNGRTFEKKDIQKKKSFFDLWRGMITAEPRFKDSGSYFFRERRKRSINLIKGC